MPTSYRLILLETSAAGLPANYLYNHYLLHFANSLSLGVLHRYVVGQQLLDVVRCSEPVSCDAVSLVLFYNVCPLLLVAMPLLLAASGS